MTVVAALDAPSPSAYAQLDRVAVLLQGRLVYHGSTGAQLARAAMRRDWACEVQRTCRQHPIDRVLHWWSQAPSW